MANYGELWRIMANYGEGFYGESGPTQLRNSPFRHNSPLVPPPRNIFIVGDFNLKSISWPRSEDMGNGNGTDRLFIDSFNGFGLDQCISGPTHNNGRTLDLMLRNHRLSR